MTRDEAIRWFTDTRRGGLALGDRQVAEACDMAIAALREQAERRWIPVTERLPEPGVRVLASDGGFVGEFYISDKGQWKRYNVNNHSLLMALDILWWMLMPESPKEG